LTPGLSIQWKPALLFSFVAGFNYSPLIFCYARDVHLIPPVRIFTDYPTFGHYLKGNGEFVFSTNKNFDLLLRLSYTHISGSRGRSYAQIHSTVSRHNPGAGAGYSALGLEFAARVRFAGGD
jgi:hypothetical protein